MIRMSSLVESLKHLLKYAQISDDAILVYSVLAGLKPRTLGEIVSLTNLSHETAERAVRELMVAKLVREIQGRPVRYEALPPYSLIKMQIEDLTRSVDEFQRTLSQNIDRSIQLLREGMEKFGESLSKTFESVITTIAGSLENIMTSIVVENIAKTLEDVMKNVLNIAVDNASKRFMDLKNNVVEEFRKSVKEAMEKFSQEISQATTSLVEDIRRLLYEQTRVQISQIISKFETSTKAINALIIKGFEKETSIPTQIQIIKGLEKIKGQVGDIVKRAQRFVIIVAPTYDLVPKDIIENLPTRVRIQIVAGVYPKHNDMIKELKKRGPTTQLRDMRGLSIYGVVADMKEALLCALPETVADPDKVLGIFTNEESWISMIQSQFSHIFMGASRL